MPRFPWRAVWIAALACSGVSGVMAAQSPGGSCPFELTPMFGYRLEGTLNPEDPAAVRISLQDHATFGINFGYWIDANGSLEVQYSRTPTEAVSASSATTPGRTLDVTVQDIQFAGLAHFRVANPRVRPYLGLGLGVTILDPGDRFATTTRFSFSLFGGVKTYLSDRLGLRFEARWIPAYLSSGGSGFWCVWLGGTAVCHASVSDVRLLEQGDFRAGLILRF
ncbi:MAG TPA: outer membrane beta-barrel protein [Thermoanaerobaculia bacterium]|nr:outer membrane beta-barrel protein [Thermoanaerobaculia bacterium]